MMFCKKCGSEIPDDAKFCSKCGEKVQTDEAETSTREKVSEFVVDLKKKVESSEKIGELKEKIASNEKINEIKEKIASNEKLGELKEKIESNEKINDLKENFPSKERLSALMSNITATKIVFALLIILAAMKFFGGDEDLDFTLEESALGLTPEESAKLASGESIGLTAEEFRDRYNRNLRNSIDAHFVAAFQIIDIRYGKLSNGKLLAEFTNNNGISMLAFLDNKRNKNITELYIISGPANNDSRSVVFAISMWSAANEHVMDSDEYFRAYSTVYGLVGNAFNELTASSSNGKLFNGASGIADFVYEKIYYSVVAKFLNNEILFAMVIKNAK